MYNKMNLAAGQKLLIFNPYWTANVDQSRCHKHISEEYVLTWILSVSRWRRLAALQGPLQPWLQPQKQQPQTYWRFLGRSWQVGWHGRTISRPLQMFSSLPLWFEVMKIRNILCKLCSGCRWNLGLESTLISKHSKIAHLVHYSTNSDSSVLLKTYSWRKVGSAATMSTGLLAAPSACTCTQKIILITVLTCALACP